MHQKGTLSDSAWEDLASTLLRKQIDLEKTKSWSQKLEAAGIRRNPAPTTTSYRKFLVAASALLILSATIWIFNHQVNDSPVRKMAATYLEQPFRINSNTARGGEQDSDFFRGRALEAFNNKQFEKSIEYLQQIERDNRATAADYFHLGLALLYQQTPNYQAALDAFSAAKKKDPSVYKDETNWFSALCYLMQEDYGPATEYLQKVVNSPSSRNQEEATQLLKTIPK